MKLWGSPRRSIRMQMAALLTVLFVLLGGALLGVSYVLVRSNLTERQHGGTAAGGGFAQLHESLEPDQRRLLLAQVEAAQTELADDTLRQLTVQYLLILAVMAVLSSALGWVVAGRLLRPVSEITATARRVSTESLHERIALEGPDDELKRLADTFDTMLARLEAAFERQAAFVRNASHELRTPLSVIRTEADVTLADEADDPDALRRSLAVVRDAGERSERLIEALLTLARADEVDHARVVLDLGELVRELISGVELDGLRLELELEPAPVLGDRDLLSAMAANLIDNAVRHNSGDGWIEVRTGLAGEEATLEISNSGARITAQEAASLTEPFRQLRTARTGDGVGLGLSIVASVAQSHEGRLEIEPLEQGGLRIRVALPAPLHAGLIGPTPA